MTNLSASTKQLPWLPDHAPSSLSGMTLKARHFHNQKARHSGRARASYPESIVPRAPIKRMTSNLKRRNDKRQPHLGANNKKSTSTEVDFNIQRKVNSIKILALISRQISQTMSLRFLHVCCPFARSPSSPCSLERSGS